MSINDLPKYSEFEDLLQERANNFDKSFFDIDLTDVSSEVQEEIIDNENSNDNLNKID